MPSFAARMEYRKAIYVRYHRASKEEKGRILDEFCRTCDFNRKYAIRLLSGPPPEPGPHRIERRRAFRYSAQVLSVARAIWQAAGYLCGQRLKAAIPLWLPKARERFPMRPAVEQDLLRISARQLDERLKAHKHQLKRRFYSTTRPGQLLKSMIPIRTSNADITQPGFLEIDLVAHCGNSLQGDFIYTLTATDVWTGWTDRVAVLGKGQRGIVEALHLLRQRLPFKVRAIDSDNGEEFLNYHLLTYCRRLRPAIAFTRSRVNKKNDNPHVEQKNWTHVRAFLGWHRFDTPQALEAINALYAKDLLYFQNLFQPSGRLASKVHLGSRILRRYDTPQTPLDRLHTTRLYHSGKFHALLQQRRHLDPFALSETLDDKLQALVQLATRAPIAPLAARKGPPLVFGRGGHQQQHMMRKAINGVYLKNFKERSQRLVTS